LNLNEKDITENKEFKEHIEKSFNEDSKSPLDFTIDKSEENDLNQKEDLPKKAHLVTKYNDVEIYRVDGELLLLYKVPTPKPSASQKLIINTLKEAATRLISTDPYKIRDPLQRKNIYYQKIIDILENAPEINIPNPFLCLRSRLINLSNINFPIIPNRNLLNIIINLLLISRINRRTRSLQSQNHRHHQQNQNAKHKYPLHPQPTHPKLLNLMKKLKSSKK